MKAMKAEDATSQSNHADHGVADPVEAAAAYGIDVSQLRDNLALPVAERLRRHQIALDTLEMLRQAKRP